MEEGSSSTVAGWESTLELAAPLKPTAKIPSYENGKEHQKENENL